MRASRIVLCCVGVAGILLGFVAMVTAVTPVEMLGVAIWMLAAIVLHDGVLAGVVLVGVLLARKAGGRVPVPSLVMIAIGLVVAGTAALLFLPEAYAKSLGTANPTVLPQDYLMHLVLFWVAVAVSTCVAILGYRILVRNRNSRSRVSAESDSARP